MRIDDFKSQLNTWGRDKVPFLFAVDFEMEKPLLWRLDEIDADTLKYNVRGVTNVSDGPGIHKIEFEKFPISEADYRERFNVVMNYLSYGDSFLTNLTVKSEIKMNCSPEELFHQSSAPYKLYIKDQFLFFSPETFIQIKNGKIFSFPMKGTIDATIPDAEKIILSDQKELSEHVTIVDLIRNDLSLVSSQVEVKRFRYVEEIKTTDKNLLQVSSEIVGNLAADYRSHLGDILLALLPAGSISGAPKKKTIEIIKEAEKEKRGYYTGVFGYFNGQHLDSGVMIRFIEQQDNKLFYRSGGGITTQSNLDSEYREVIDKIYVPVN